MLLDPPPRLCDRCNEVRVPGRLFVRVHADGYRDRYTRWRARPGVEGNLGDRVRKRREQGSEQVKDLAVWGSGPAVKSVSC